MHRFLLVLLSILKSETFLFSAIISAYNSKELPVSSIFAYIFFGSLFYNLLIFSLGRLFIFHVPESLLSKNSAEKIFIFLEKHKIGFIVLYRFVSGFKLFSAFLISRKVTFKEFFILNIIGDFLWSSFCVVLCKLLIFFNVSLSGKVFLALLASNTAISIFLLYYIFVKIKD